MQELGTLLHVGHEQVGFAEYLARVAVYLAGFAALAALAYLGFGMYAAVNRETTDEHGEREEA